MITHKINKNDKGFTLIELLVVISIVALLATVAIVAMNNARMESRDNKRKADIRQVASALEVYFDEFEQYPFNGPSGSGGYNEMDFPNLTYKWDSSCGTSPQEPAGTGFLTPLQDAEIMLLPPEDPSYTTQINCYIYSSTTSSDLYANKYYLIADMENSSQGSNSCDLTLPADRYCVMNTED